MTDREHIDGAAGSSRRDFIKRVSVGAAFSVPVIASFSMSGLSSASAGPAANASNGSNQPSN